MGSTRARTRWTRASAAVTRESGQPARSHAVRARCVARSRSPSRNQVGKPSPPRAARQVKPSPARPHVAPDLDTVVYTLAGIEVRRDVEPEELLVVAGVADDRESPRVSAPAEAREEPGPIRRTDPRRLTVIGN